MIAFIAYYCVFNELTNKFKSWREEKVEVNYSFVFLKFRFTSAPTSTVVGYRTAGGRVSRVSE